VLSGREDQIDVSHYSPHWFIRNSIKSFKIKSTDSASAHEAEDDYLHISEAGGL
jgi:hypothetical protein